MNALSKLFFKIALIFLGCFCLVGGIAVVVSTKLTRALCKLTAQPP